VSNLSLLHLSHIRLNNKKMKDQCVNFWRYTILVFLCISSVAAFVVLGVDLDWLVNGPEFAAKAWSRIKERLANEDVLESDGELQKNFLAAQESVWIQLFVILIVTVTIITLMVNLLGCVGSCFLSYSLLSGFTTFMFMSMIFAVTGACLYFVPLTSNESPSLEAMSLELIRQYQSGSNGAAHIIIDAVQRELQCCGFNSFEDWNSGVSMKTQDLVMERTLTSHLPSSCCPLNERICSYEAAFITPCVDMIHESYLNHDNVIGVIGITVIATVSFIGLTFISSLILCCIARRSRGSKWSVVNWANRDNCADSVIQH